MKDEHTYEEKMARNGPKKVIYKGTFISIQTLLENWYHSSSFITAVLWSLDKALSLINVGLSTPSKASLPGTPTRP